MYKGEYLDNKKWNGKGYDKNGKIIYELVNGNGKVIEYHPCGEIKFEGEYLNGKKNGYGREYDGCGNLAFEGEYMNDERNGKGTSYDIDSYGYYGYGKIIFKGEYLNDEPIYQ